MHALVTGGAGFIGSHLCDALINKGHSVTCLDIAATEKIEHLLDSPQFELVKGDVTDKSLVRELVAEADIVFHMAAVVGLDNVLSSRLRSIQVNVGGTQAVLEAAFEFGRKVIFSSTSEVYGRNPNVPWSEDDDIVLGATHICRWSYAVSKALGEHLCFGYGEQGLPFVIVRYFNVYGPRLDAAGSGRVVSVFVGQVLRGEPITVIGDGRQTRCFTYIDDAIRATIAAAEIPEAEGQVFNIGSDRETTILELAHIIREVSGRTDLPIVHVPKETRYGRQYEDIPRRVPDITKMRQILGVEPQVDLREGLRRTFEWFALQTASAPPALRRAAGQPGVA